MACFSVGFHNVFAPRRHEKINLEFEIFKSPLQASGNVPKDDSYQFLGPGDATGRSQPKPRKVVNSETEVVQNKSENGWFIRKSFRGSIVIAYVLDNFGFKIDNFARFGLAPPCGVPRT